MNGIYDVMVAGGGAAGLTAAAFCARAGLRTLLCERNEKTGGLIHTFHHRGFSFDGGIRAFEDSGALLPMLRLLGIDMDFVQNPVTIGIGERSVRLNGKESLAGYAALLCSYFPQNAGEIERIMQKAEEVMHYMDVLYGAENPLFLESELRDPVYLTKTLLPWLLQYIVNIKKASRLHEPIEQYLLHFTQNKALIDMICQHFFAETPAFFALSYFRLYLDYRYPHGGTGVLPERLEQYIRGHGGEIAQNAEVVCVLPHENTAVLKDGRRAVYRNLIWAADQTSLYRAVQETLPPKAHLQKARAEAAKGIDSVLTVFAGTCLPPETVESACGAHAFFTPLTSGISALPAWQPERCGGTEAMQKWAVAYLKTTTYEISVPTLRDPSLAPEGKTGLIISTLFDYDLAKWFHTQDAYEAFKSLCIETILRVLDASVLPGLSESTEFAICATPLTLERKTANRHGAITGWAYTNAVMPAVSKFGSIRKAVETDIPGVLQCGHWTFSPAGLPVAVITGKLAADAAAARGKKARRA